MANYQTIDEVKAELDITMDKYDALIMGWIDAASGLIDKLCNRHFDKRTAETRYFDGAGGILFIDDLVTVTTFKLDKDGDGTYEVTMATTDYLLYPFNATPKLWVEINPNGDYSSFASGIRKGVEIIGDWGYNEVPGAVRQACMIQVCRWHKRKDSGYATAVVGSTETGEIPLYTNLDPDVSLILKTYHRPGV